MSDFKVHILGCGSAMPTGRHLPSCQVVEFRGRLMMVDCGEGAQGAFMKQGLSFARLTDIFISHLHGDHLLGLPGLLSTLSLRGKEGHLRVHIFEEGARLMADIMALVAHDTNYTIEYCPVPRNGGVVVDDHNLRVTAFPLHHGTPCVGFRFDEKPGLRHLRGDVANYYGIPVYARQSIKAGADFTMPDGTVIPNERLTLPPSPAASYAYCSDTAYHPHTARAVEGVTTLYHEATYLASDPGMSVKARERGHSTAAEAGRVAREAGAGSLIVGHYSSRYSGVAEHAAEAATEFQGPVTAANETLTIDIK